MLWGPTYTILEPTGLNGVAGWGLSRSHNWKNLSKAPWAARGPRPRWTNLLDWEQELTEKSEKPVLRALATGVERKDRQEKGSLSLLQPLRIQAAYLNSNQQQGKKTEDRDPSLRKEN